MAQITFITRSAERRSVTISTGLSVMQGAIGKGVPGIVAECGGSCICGTCQVYVEGGPVEHLPPISEEEAALLDEATGERRPNSRLSCQLKVSDLIDGLVVAVADNG